MTDPKVSDEAFCSLAREMLGEDFEIDGGDDDVSRNETVGGSDGAYVKVWVWIDNPEVNSHGE